VCLMPLLQRLRKDLDMETCWNKLLTFSIITVFVSACCQFLQVTGGNFTYYMTRGVEIYSLTAANPSPYYRLIFTRYSFEHTILRSSSVSVTLAKICTKTVLGISTNLRENRPSWKSKK